MLVQLFIIVVGSILLELFKGFLGVKIIGPNSISRIAYISAQMLLSVAIWEAG